jgi:putative oxygen-independent coproporphyrinogen III oxidase
MSSATQDISAVTKLPPLSLYIHFPWCVAKCPYCDFNSHSLRGELPEAAYIDALLADLSMAAAAVAGREVVSIFMGGGTPSLFSAAELQRLLAGVENTLRCVDDLEVTLEANPGAVEHAAFAEYRAAGINRLSLGVQSFSDAKLRALGRIHDANAAITAFREARSAGFDNINLDLMYALPEQSLTAARDDLETALQLQPEHLSYYHLTLEPNTIFYSRPPELPDSDAAWAIQEQAVTLLTAAGYQNYEVSAWASDARFCQHNLNYWRYGDYLGIGAGAHGKLTFEDGAIRRYAHAAHPREYLRRVQEGAASKVTEVSTADRGFEFMLNVLRLSAGFSAADFQQRTGLDIEVVATEIQLAKQKQLLAEEQPGLFRPTERGWRFLDDLQAIFLPPD